MGFHGVPGEFRGGSVFTPHVQMLRNVIFPYTTEGFRAAFQGFHGTPFVAEQPPFKIKKEKKVRYDVEMSCQGLQSYRGSGASILEFYGSICVPAVVLVWPVLAPV